MSYLALRKPFIMKINSLVLALSLSMGFVSECVADEAMLRVRALRAARKMVRTAPSSQLTAMKNTNFQGIWGGRYFYTSRGSTCRTRVASFDFRHVLLTKGGSGFLSTNHDGDFTGRSRDKGRKWEFVKGMTIGGRPAALAIVYQSLARNGNSAGTGAAISIQGGCIVAYGANAIRMAR
ncbi:MAG: hypothetical protein RIS36_2351 [Pseudomonadota bacterium]|jgi:hypothetical protein